MCISAERKYRGSVTAPAAARDFSHSIVIAMLIPAGWRLADDVAIVISELVTAGVDSAAKTIDVKVTVHFDHLEIEVAHPDLVPAATNGSSTAAAQTRDIVLEGLTTRLSRESLADGRICARAEMRCDPLYTEAVACQYRPV